MKKFSFLLTLACVLMLLGSCSKENEYVIKGIAEDYPDGTKVYLMMRDKPNWNNMDSAIVQNGKFEMKGQVAPGYLGFIGVKDTRHMIVVEPGEITIDMKDGNPHGTANNEALTVYNQTMNGLDEQMAEISSQMEKMDIKDTANYIKLSAQLDELDKEEMQLLAKVIKENITNPLGVGLYCFYNSVFADDVDFLFTLSQQIPKEYLQQSYVATVLENVSIISCTSVGNQYTNLVMTTREGNEITLDSLVKNNKYVLIDYWASWCAPCRQSLPGIRVLNERFKDKGLCIIGISLDELKDRWDAAIEKYQMDWIQVSELKGWDSELAAAYGVRAIPATVLIDSTGTIIGRNLEAAQIAEVIESDLVEMK